MMSKTDLDPERILKDEGYKKHLKRHANKLVLLPVVSLQLVNTLSLAI